jgi:hypothetical protein
MPQTSRSLTLGLSAAVIAVSALAGCATHSPAADDASTTPPAVVTVKPAAAAPVGVVAVTTTAVATPTSAAMPSPAGAKATMKPTPKPPATTTLQFVAVDQPGNMALEDLGSKDTSDQGPDIGDLLAFTQTLQRNGKQAGEVHVFAVGVDHTQHLSEATGTVVLADGTIQVAGIVPQSPAFTLPVVGGTGRFLADTGTMDFNAGGPSEKITLHLIAGTTK